MEKFATDLRANGVDAWYSKWEIKPGDSIRAKIDEGLEGCEFFIIVISKSSIARPWVQAELDAATIGKLNGRVRKIIPVKIEKCGDLPPTLSSLCWEDFSNQPYESAMKRVLDSIFGVDVRPPLGSPPQPLPLTGLYSQPASQRATHQPSTRFVWVDALGALVKALRSEGFAAAKDSVNETRGMRLGPKGLDAKRLKPDSGGSLFLPWSELNHPLNQQLVQARRFNEIVESRPPDWDVRHPYPGPQPRAMRHWNRSACLPGSKELEESIQQELVRRFAEAEVPVNIDVFGAQNNTYAFVQITNFDAGIYERAKAIPEDFIGRGEMMAAVISAVERVLSDLRNAGKIPG